MLPNYQVVTYGKVGHPITVLQALQLNNEVYLLAAGHFNALKVFHQGNVSSI
jgi:hypothetical protein